MDNRKLFATFAILMLALGIAGFAYAHWEKTITIDGDIDSGIFDLIIISASSDDPPGSIDPGKDKDVATTTITIDPEDPEKAYVTITNAYPSYYVYWHITVRNVGTIPAKLYAIEIDNPNECLEVSAWDGQYEQLDPFSWWDGNPETILNHQGDYSGYVHVKQCAEPGATYTFTVRIVFWNWNELP